MAQAKRFTAREFYGLHDTNDASWLVMILREPTLYDHVAFSRNYSRSAHAYLEERNTENLVDAMKAFSGTHATTANMPPAYKDTLGIQWVIVEKPAGAALPYRWIGATMGYGGTVIEVSPTILSEPTTLPTQDRLLKEIESFVSEIKASGEIPPHPPLQPPVPGSTGSTTNVASKPVWPLSDEDLREIALTAKDIGARAADLALVLYAESGLRRDAVHPTGSARGVNQLSLAGAKSIGLSEAQWMAIPKKSFHEQMLYVRKFFLRIRKGYEDAGVLYQANFAPATLGKTDVLYEAFVKGIPNDAYSANAGLDIAKKGYITTSDLRVRLRTVAEKQDFKSLITRMEAMGLLVGGGPVIGVIVGTNGDGSGSAIKTVMLAGAAAFGAWLLLGAGGGSSRSRKKTEHEDEDSDESEESEGSDDDEEAA